MTVWHVCEYVYVYIYIYIYIYCLFWESKFDPSDLLSLAQNTPGDLKSTTHNIHKRDIYTSPPGLEFVNSAGERLQAHALDRASNGIGDVWFKPTK